VPRYVHCANALTQVIICGRRFDTVQTTADELSSVAKESGNNGSVIAIQADVSTKEGVVEFFDRAKEHLDQGVSDLLGKADVQLDVLINNAGFSSGWKDNTSLGDATTLEKKLWSIDEWVILGTANLPSARTGRR
jgi:NAD(P)-dependent dehydrogenase (short-subunit alcohol dehydrogenase family)